MQAQSAAPELIAPSVISFVLAPSIARAQAPGMKKLYLTPAERSKKPEIITI
jgi:hypothetical protein